ncbi:sigma-70 family RNA polymerase sigma factor [Priestia taiwanensis]|uniref:RNA polymerase subunit sigma-24 n=1 Tax=Priestia taiwanensis TaxID=1347902 RepID=A0A917ALY7_9BACI|nr:sigma-70 family RNA polymerase sigma factor [Priestia taiwanensis]MBM7362333.1 RNA polymerase sigma-70 factor (ECF subfamily) [Priestia taiwanensis]GGE61321.1 hypothetical protein GCM10007140_09560 [Priestia taiwanensis]
MNIARLVKQARRGDKEALLQLIIAKKDEYYRLALTYTGNEHDAMDTMEEMIVSVYDNIEKLRDAEAFYSWSKTILVNNCRALTRKKQKVVLVDEWEEINTHASTINPYTNSEHQMDIQMLLEQSNDQQKEAIQLKYFHDFDNQTIAKITNVSIGTVKSRIFQGLKKLRKYYGGDGNE